MIRQQRLINTFTDLVLIDSPSRGERAMCDALRSMLEELGAVCSEDDTGDLIGGSAGNLFARIDGDLDLPPLLFSAHMDTVEPSAGKRAVVHPDGRITSDGTTVLGSDDLSGVAAILEALRTIRDEGLPHRPLEVLFSVSEETYCTGAKHFDYGALASREAYVLDLSGPIGTAAARAPTLISFSAELTGRAAHAAFAPESGAHAIKAAAAAIAAVDCGHVGDTTVNIGTIRGGTADNIVPDRCVVTGEVRSFSDSAADRTIAAIEKTITDEAEKHGVTTRFLFEKHLTAYETDGRHPVVRRFEDACRSIGLEPTLCDTYGGSDNHHFALHGVTGVVAASGMSDCHSCAEHTSVDELSRAAELTLALMLSPD